MKKVTKDNDVTDAVEIDELDDGLLDDKDKELIDFTELANIDDVAEETEESSTEPQTKQEDYEFVCQKCFMITNNKFRSKTDSSVCEDCE